MKLKRFLAIVLSATIIMNSSVPAFATENEMISTEAQEEIVEEEVQDEIIEEVQDEVIGEELPDEMVVDVLDTVLVEETDEDVLMENIEISVLNSVEESALNFDAAQSISSEQQVGGNLGDNIQWTLNENGLLNIVGSGDMPIGDFFSEYESEIKKIVISEGITSVHINSTNNFNSYKNVTEISLPNTLIQIGDYAFCGFENLITINIPSQLTNIGAYAFAQCKGLEEIELLENITSIGNDAFKDCDNLTIYSYYGTAADNYASQNNIDKHLYGYKIVYHNNYDIDTNPVVYDCYYKKAEHILSVEDLLNNQEGTLSDRNELYYGYEFLEWSGNKDGSGDIYFPYDEFKLDAGSDGNEIHLYAQWRRVYKIEYNLDGGYNHPDNPEKYYLGNVVNLKDAQKEGYIFLGWYLDKSSSVKITEISASSECDVVLYARWDKEYMINYHLDDGINHIDNPEVYGVRSKSITLKDPTRSGYNFKGWYADSNFKKKISKITAGSTGDLDLYAKWELAKYTITYQLNGGTNPSKNPKSYTITTNTMILLEPTKKGAFFEGWFLDENFEVPVTKIETGEFGNKTLYAKWYDHVYTVEYHLNGGTNHDDNLMEYTVSSPTYTLLEASKDGYTFKGWYADSKFKKKVSKITAGSTGDLDLYAKWEVAKYTITYQMNGGTNPSKNPKSYTITTDTIVLLEPTKKGAEFEGWFLDENFEVPITEIETGEVGNKTLYAKWYEFVYTVEYHLDGGINHDDNPTEYTVSIPTHALLEASKDGYTFKGWYADSKFKKKVSKINTGSTGDLDLYAKWEVAKYTITYQMNGGTNPSKNPKSYTITTDTIVLLEPTKKGAEFEGWFLDENFEVPITGIETGEVGNKTLYAKWYDYVYVVNYHLDGGINHDDNPTEYTVSSPSHTLLAATKDGHTFKGWYTDSNFKKKISKINAGSIGNLDLYAKWDKVKYSITYQLDGGKNHSLNPKTYYVSLENIELFPATKTGYIFDGWYIDETCQNAFNEIEAGCYGNLKLYAKWTPNTYHIFFDSNVGNSIGVMSSMSVLYDTTIELPYNEFYCSPLTFVGWNTEPDGSGKSFMDGESVSNLTKVNDDLVILYAQWKFQGPTIYSVEKKSYRHLKITWSYSKEVDGYEVYRSTSSKGNYMRLASFDADYGDYTNYWYIDSLELKENKTYYYKVRSYVYGDNGNVIYSDFSSVESGKTAEKPKFIGTLLVGTSNYGQVLGVVIENKGKKTFTIGGDEITDCCFYYPSISSSSEIMGYMFEEQNGSSYWSEKVDIKAGKIGCGYYWLDNKTTHYYSGYVAFYFHYDGCLYTGVVDRYSVSVFESII